MLLALMVLNHVLVPLLGRDAGTGLWILLCFVVVPVFCVVLLVAFGVAAFRTGRVIPYVVAAFVPALVLWLMAVQPAWILKVVATR
jgi:hypothetical protein